MEPAMNDTDPLDDRTLTPAKGKRRKTSPSLAKLRDLRRLLTNGHQSPAAEAQRAKGKLTARERLRHLLDDDTFVETGLMVRTRSHEFDLQRKAGHGDGVITGFGTIDGRRVAIYLQDFTMLGGSLGLAHAEKICRLMDAAFDSKIPVIGILDSGGARIQEGVDSLDGYAEIFKRNAKLSGVVPQISVILGPCAGGAVYSPALTDFVFMVEGISYMFVTGPSVVRAATGENVDFDTLGGSAAHASRSGVCHFVGKSEPDCFRQVRELLSFLPSSRFLPPPYCTTTDSDTRTLPILEKICELDPQVPYRVHHVIWRASDDKMFLEVHRDFAKNIVTGFMRLGGETVGVVANNPSHSAGALDVDSTEKAARFVQFCDCFNIPILTLVDVPGYWPGLDQEHRGIIRRGAKLLYAYAVSTVPKVTVIMRKAYGGAYIAMGSKRLGADFNFASPAAEIAVMGPRGAVEILYSKELAAAADPGALKEKLAKEYAERFASPYQAASSGSVDEVIEPRELRRRLIQVFRILRDKRTPGEGPARGNPPL
jgi:acetyl-CoA carboxylase carboxyltransferase component